MPKNPNRPKIKYKKVGRKPKPPNKTPEEIAQGRLKKLETRLNITPQRVSSLIHKERGLLTYVCRALKIPRSTLLRYIDKHDLCVEALDQARNAMGDKAEQKLFELIEAGDVRCILYYLSTVHRHRGYGMNNSDAAENNNSGPVFVETVNIVGIPSGTFLPKEIASQDNMVIDN
jgi:hypothetical protein